MVERYFLYKVSGLSPKRELTRKRLGGSNQAAPIGTFDQASPETRADPVGPNLFRGNPHITYSGGSSFWRGASFISRAHHPNHAVGNGGDVGDGGERWAR